MLILLDIDGVMVPGNSWRPVEFLNDGFMKFSDKAVISLKKIISETNATIVLTTSHKSKFTITQWENIFSNRNLNVPIKKLNNSIDNLSRKDEILDWFNNRTIQENFVIIDDDKTLNGLPENIKAKCVLTSSLIGLDEYKAFDAINILKKSQLVTV